MRGLSIIFVLCLTFFMLQLHAAEDLPTPGNVYLIDGLTQENVYIIQQGFKDVSWSRDDRGQAVTSRPTVDVERVEYTPIPRSERGYLRAQGAFNARNWNNALDGFAEAAKDSRYEFIRVDAHLKRAQALLRLKRYDEALADAQVIITQYKDWVQVVDAMALVGEIHAASGNQDAAIKAYQALRQAAKGFGPKYGSIAMAKGALGEAQLLTAADKSAAAVPLLRQAYEAVSITSAAQEHGVIAVALGNALIASNADADAKKVFFGLRYAPVGPESRSQAFLALGKLDEKAGDKVSALDNYIIAAVIRGGDDAAAVEAKRHARSLLSEFGADESLDPETQKEYRAYGTRF